MSERNIGLAAIVVVAALLGPGLGTHQDDRRHNAQHPDPLPLAVAPGGHPVRRGAGVCAVSSVDVSTMIQQPCHGHMELEA